MKVVFAGFLLCFVLAFAKPVHDDGMIDEINSNSAATWVAGHNKHFEGWTMAQARGLLGTSRPTRPFDGIPFRSTVRSIPESFDAREAWKGLITPILDQGQCGSCWAFGTAEAFSDRWSIKKNSSQVTYSPQYLVSCDIEFNMGCNGGMPHLAWDYLEFGGIPSLECLPYTSGTGEVAACHHECSSTSIPFKKAYAKKFKTSGLRNEKEVQESIIQYGPVTGTFDVYEDFMSYKSGVYRHLTGEYEGGHAVKIVGWGVDSAKTGLKYWIVANSWNTDWGMDGYFWIERGTDECGIDSGSCAGEAED